MTSGCKNVFSIPLPSQVDTWEVSGTELYGLKGITEPYYSELNNKIVKKLPKNYEAKRRVIDRVTRTFKKDSEGNPIYEEVKIPSGSIVVLSEIQIGLPYDRYKITTKDSYGYIDFVVEGDKTLYMYIVPKEVCYKVNQTALALSVKSMKNYSGMGYTTWSSGVIYLHVIPYNPNAKYVGTKILKTGHSTSYEDEIRHIVDYWVVTGYIPDIKFCKLMNEENLCLKPTVVGYDFYIPIESIPISSKEIFGSEGGTTDVQEQEDSSYN